MIFRVGWAKHFWGKFTDTKLKWTDKLCQNTDWIPEVQKFINTKFVNLLTEAILPTSGGGFPFPSPVWLRQYLNL